MAEGVENLTRAQRGEHRAVGEAAKAEDDAQPLHGGALSSQEGPAVGCLGPCWLVLRRHAAHCIGDTAVDQAEPIARMAAIAALGGADLPEGALAQVAGVELGRPPRRTPVTTAQHVCRTTLAKNN